MAEKKYDEILGVHIIGPSATELIGEAGAAMKLEATSEDLVRTIHAHPTLSEAIHEASEAVAGPCNPYLARGRERADPSAHHRPKRLPGPGKRAIQSSPAR